MTKFQLLNDECDRAVEALHGFDDVRENYELKIESLEEDIKNGKQDAYNLGLKIDALSKEKQKFLKEISHMEKLLNNEQSEMRQEIVRLNDQLHEVHLEIQDLRSKNETLLQDNMVLTDSLLEAKKVNDDYHEKFKIVDMGNHTGRSPVHGDTDRPHEGEEQHLDEDEVPMIKLEGLKDESHEKMIAEFREIIDKQNDFIANLMKGKRKRSELTPMQDHDDSMEAISQSDLKVAPNSPIRRFGKKNINEGSNNIKENLHKIADEDLLTSIAMYSKDKFIAKGTEDEADTRKEIDSQYHFEDKTIEKDHPSAGQEGNQTKNVSVKVAPWEEDNKDEHEEHKSVIDISIDEGRRDSEIFLPEENGHRYSSRLIPKKYYEVYPTGSAEKLPKTDKLMTHRALGDRNRQNNRSGNLTGRNRTKPTEAQLEKRAKIFNKFYKNMKMAAASKMANETIDFSRDYLDVLKRPVITKYFSKIGDDSKKVFSDAIGIYKTPTKKSQYILVATCTFRIT